MKYSQGFRNSVLRKVLPPENRSVYAVAKEVGLSPVTIHSWLSRLKDGTLSFDQEGSEPVPSGRGALCVKIVVTPKLKEAIIHGVLIEAESPYSEKGFTTL